MSLRIIKPGVADGFYDEGRYGFQHLGINPGGVMDAVAMQTINALVLNNPNEAVLEMHFPSAKILFEQDALIALSGANFSPEINKQNIPVNKPIFIKSGSILACKNPVSGARTYLAVHGGFELINWLNSYSINLDCQAGGFHGRRLQINDVISLKLNQDYCNLLNNKAFRILPFEANIKELYRQDEISFLPGRQFKCLTEQSRQQLTTERFFITGNSNRMGYKLQSPPMRLLQEKQLVSSAVTKGTIQLLPNGQLIVLMADHQTTGGYPVIGHVISADISTLAQRTAGSGIRFKLTNQASAETALINQHRHLLQLRNACNLRLKEFIINANSRS